MLDLKSVEKLLFMLYFKDVKSKILSACHGPLAPYVRIISLDQVCPHFLFSGQKNCLKKFSGHKNVSKKAGQANWTA